MSVAVPAAFDASHAAALQTLLQSALVSEQSTQTAAAKALESCEQVPGFAPTLMVRGALSCAYPSHVLVGGVRAV